MAGIQHSMKHQNLPEQSDESSFCCLSDASVCVFKALNEAGHETFDLHIMLLLYLPRISNEQGLEHGTYFEDPFHPSFFDLWNFASQCNIANDLLDVCRSEMPEV